MKKNNRISAYVEELGIPAHPELDPHYSGFFTCFNRGDYYEAHDVLEQLWLRTEGADRPFFQGLIQIAGAFVHLQKQFLRPDHPKDGRRLRPASRLFEMGIRNIAPFVPVHHRLDVRTLVALCEAQRAALAEGNFARNPWSPENGPKINLSQEPALPSASRSLPIGESDVYRNTASAFSPNHMAIPLSTKFDVALVFASMLHRDQIRKGSGIPYVAHLLSVAAIALEYGADEEEAIAALLHDAIEDQAKGDVEGLKDRIRTTFGEKVLAIVEACTDAEVIPKPPWRERKERYVAHLGDASPSALLVSASDKLHNARTILSDLRTVGADVWSRFNGGRDGSLWYYRALVAAFEKRGRSALTDELNRVVSEIESLYLNPKSSEPNPSSHRQK